jgi:VWFA-related protein
VTKLIVSFFAATLLLAQEEAVSVLALDRQGRPVTDLKSDEIQLFDNGKPAPITSFGRLANPSASPTVIVYDLLNTATGARGNVPQQIARAVQQAEGKASIQLFLLTADGAISPVVVAQDAETGLENAMRGTSVVLPKHLEPIGARVKATYEALGQLYNTVRSKPGRKTIVWISHGVPTSAISTSGTPVDYMPVLKKFASGLGREQVVIYPVQQTIRAGAAPNDTSRDTLQEFAEWTGGRLYSNETIDKAIAEAVRDTDASYVLNYAAKADGKFHTLRLDSARPGVHLQARKGYFAEP